MHSTALSNSYKFRSTYFPDLSGKVVVEVGSQDVNGSIRAVFDGCEKYFGLDFCKAKGVDILLSDPYELPLEGEFADIVICSSVFEHSEFFWLLFNEILRILKPAGLFYLNVPSNGSFHRYPVDCWRFYPDAGNALANWGRRSGYPVTLLESYVSAQDVQCWNDFVAIFIKDGDHKDMYNNRILDSFAHFNNGSLDRSETFLNLEELTEDQKRLSDLSSQLRKTKAGFGQLEISKIQDSNFLLTAFIDSPNKETHTSNGSKLLVRGWALPKTPSRVLSLAIRENGLLRCFPFNESRPDVVRKILSEEPAGHKSLVCGFKYEFSFEGAIEIGIESGAELAWLGQYSQ